ncbi:Signal transduction histidine kinase [Modestobacter sp. DSM 44400]|nr:Signal transduction histidine kinase [Modestobacter sp. DSM 44400]
MLSVFAAVLATSLFGIPLAYGVAQYFLGDERAEAERAADTVAIAVAADVLRGRPPTDLPGTDGDITVGLYATDGARLAGVGPARADAVVRHAGNGRVASADDTSGQLVVAVPVTDGAEVTGIVRAASDYSSVRTRIATAWALMLGLGALAVSVTWLLARRQARRLALPLESLAATAHRLGDGDFSVRTGTSGIPEIDEAGRALDTTAHRLGALVDRERSFSADASHQLRTPLTGLRLGLETALEQPAVGQRAAMLAAIESADQLERTIEDLLSLARDAGPRGALLPVADVVAEVATAWRPVLAGQGRSLDVTVEEELPTGRASAAAVRQVIGVLLDNAVDHGAGTVTLAVRDAGGVLAIDVADEGAGPPDPDLLFHRRAEGARGHGIGLSLARSLAEADGGRLLLSRLRPPVFTLLVPAGAEES